MAGRPWFAPRRIGWGLKPVSWQGWLLTVAYIAIVIVAAHWLAGPQPWIFWTVLAATTVVYFLVAILTKGER